MFEGYTFETVLSRMLDRLPNPLDRREGSFLYTALAPAAWELSEAYANLDRALADGFAATATRESLILLGRERGIAPKGATCAVILAKFTPTDVEIPIGTRVSVGDVEYTVTAEQEPGIYRLTCRDAGEVGNVSGGEVSRYNLPSGVESATVLGVFRPGEEEEETESFRARYFETLTAQAFGGNRADYVTRIGAIAGVGSVKILPAWNGEGTVKAIITDETGMTPDAELLSRVQAEVDGFSPIGHTVTVSPAILAVLDVEAKLELEDGADEETVHTRVMDTLIDRFDLLLQEWHEREESVVRKSKLHACILGCEGVAGVTDLAIGGKRENITLSAEELPILGDIILS